MRSFLLFTAEKILNMIITETTGKTMRFRRKFTLIELLLVIAIISILASILLPALRSAKESSNSIVCSSQQKQIVTANFQYANDFDGYIIGYACRPPEINGARGYAYMFAETMNYATWDVMLCPSQPKEYILKKTFLGLWGGSYAAYGAFRPFYWGNTLSDSYLNPRLDEFGNFSVDERTFKLSKMKAPTRTYLYTDSICGDSSRSNYQYQISMFHPHTNHSEGAYTFLNHKKQANCTFVDGHVEGKNKTDLTKDGYKRMMDSNLNLLVFP